MKNRLFLAFLVAAGPAHAGASSDSDYSSRHTKAGDVLQVGIPLAAFGLTFLLKDPGSDAGDLARQPSGAGFDWKHLNGSPRHNFGVAFARAELTTYGLKYSVNERRPNGGAQSFPSGHTAMAFMGAEFIRKEYGWAWGIPAWLAAGYVGWTRIESGNHWTRDVVAGAAIGVLSNHDLPSFGTPAGAVSIGSSLVPAPSVGADAGGEAAARSLADPQATLVPTLQLELRF